MDGVCVDPMATTKINDLPRRLGEMVVVGAIGEVPMKALALWRWW